MILRLCLSRNFFFFPGRDPEERILTKAGFTGFRIGFGDKVKIWHFYWLSPSHILSSPSQIRLSSRRFSSRICHWIVIITFTVMTRKRTIFNRKSGSPFTTWASVCKNEYEHLDGSGRKHRTSIADPPSVEPANKWKDISGAHITGYRSRRERAKFIASNWLQNTP